MNKENTKNSLIFIPTYNERENIAPLFRQILALQSKDLQLDILFLDDNSPDGTGKVMDDFAAAFPRVYVIHRAGKLGIGSAHKEGIRWAYDRGYACLVTMDADFTHSPLKILDFLRNRFDCDVIVASRYMMKESLNGWNLLRKFLTRFGHALTVFLLGLKYDATGAFRLYRLDRVPRDFLSLIHSDGYSFFFESLHLLDKANFRIREIPIELPPRTYGHSKMSLAEIFRSIGRLLNLFVKYRSHSSEYHLRIKRLRVPL